MESTRPTKHVKLLVEDAHSDQEGGTPESNTLKINNDFARRFEHNKKRDERMRLEEKYGADDEDDDDDDDEGTSSSSESEDEGALATQEVDDEISATLQAIRAKDPRVYDKDHTFYKQNQESANHERTKHRDKPITLQDYHRNNLLKSAENSDHTQPPRPTYAEEQDALKRDIIRSIHDSTTNDDPDALSSDDGDLLRTKHQPEEVEATKPVLPSVDEADKNPDAFLNSLMASRAWIPNDTAELHPFESDDEDEDEEADEFEEAYNMRFEDPERANEKLRSHSRKAAAEISVRREQAKGRKRVRGMEKARKSAERQERENEKARLRNLRIEQAHTKLQQFREAAGLEDKDLPVEEWSKFLETAFDSDKWDEEMQKRFDDNYYAKKDQSPLRSAAEARTRSRSSKPAWADDIDINDIVPEFDKADDAEFSLSEMESTQDAQDVQDSKNGFMQPDNNDHQANSFDQGKNSGDKLDDRANRKKRARKDRRQIEELVDSRLVTDMLPSTTSKGNPGRAFRYRETSPKSFGLSARDILLADDRLLNQHHGLKKLAAFRDTARKEKDRRKLDRKQLRKWRKETFGSSQGPQITFRDYVHRKLAGEPTPTLPATTSKVKRDGAASLTKVEEKKKKKRKRSKGGKGGVHAPQ